MSEVQFQQLDPVKLPLVKPIYKAFYPLAKPKKNETIVVGYLENKIITIVRFRPIDTFWLLTGMLVVPDHRTSGVACQLLQFCKREYFNDQYFCFAYSHLESLYATAGFKKQEIVVLPTPLRQLFERYTANGKNLIAMRYIK